VSRAGPLQVWALLLGGALVTWIVTYERMDGMDGGPGTALGGLGWFLGVWIVMMAAMMFPSVAPMVLLHARIAQGRSGPGMRTVPTWIFLSGYLAVWTAFGLVAYAVYHGIAAFNLDFLAWDEQGPLVAGGAIVAAGVYQLTPLKRVCLRHCRSPLHFVMHDWREGRLGAFRMGGEHGTYCVGCCVGLMLILFALGVMSLLWMAAVATLIFAEKILPFGSRLQYALAVCFVALGVFVAVAPGSVPGLTEPSAKPAMKMGSH
jgi:predicted metal-binding membrane protein